MFNKILDHLTKNKKITIVATVAIVILFLVLTGGQRPQEKKDARPDQPSGKGVMTKDEGTAGELNAMRQQLQQIIKEREEEKKANEAKKLTETVQTLPSFKPLDAAPVKKHRTASLFDEGDLKSVIAPPSPPPPPPPPPPVCRRSNCLPLRPL